MRDQGTQDTASPLSVCLVLGNTVIQTGGEGGPDVCISDLARIIRIINASKLDL